ncbi:gliding motility-associated ABC transporter permease subunit GldF [Croceimicrobium sp.]|uniref:gliding motility-associated ABC transporter permease subunit GldF n=1 Tax=Croceimicrobium sp. TaxID=2828340 RepID=UPI003BA84AA6
MIALIQKEIRSFFGSIIGYLVILVYLLINGVFLWLFPGNFNILDGGYASLGNLFTISPWVFLFLIPALSMRLFADEKKAGTLEILLTKPLSDLQIILAKYIAGLFLLLLALLPTLLYYYSVYELGNPAGNVDSGGTFGSYIGLLFLGGAFLSIGLFASSLTDNQIVAFLLAMFLCFFVFYGFDQIAGFDLFGSADLLILKLGINEHYVSMSRGVLDSRDLLFFVSVIALFIGATRVVIQSRKW